VQLSVAVALNVTLLFEHCPASVFAAMFAGQVIVGGCASTLVVVGLVVTLIPPSAVTVA
jgi:hypothetical protein